MKIKEKTIYEWFDPYDINHIKAYKHLQDAGTWPVGFIPNNVSFPPFWQMELCSKMGQCWVEEKLFEEEK